MLVKYRPADSFLSPFLHDFFRPGWPGVESDMVPRCDILERANDYLIQVEVPGIRKEDVKVEYKDHLLTISGEKKLEEDKEGEKFFCRERHYGAFSRTFRLGDEIDSNKINAKHENGVLQVHLPKSEQVQAKIVDVQVS